MASELLAEAMLTMAWSAAVQSPWWTAWSNSSSCSHSLHTGAFWEPGGQRFLVISMISRALGSSPCYMTNINHVILDRLCVCQLHKSCLSWRAYLAGLEGVSHIPGGCVLESWRACPIDVEGVSHIPGGCLRELEGVSYICRRHVPHTRRVCLRELEGVS